MLPVSPSRGRGRNAKLVETVRSDFAGRDMPSQRPYRTRRRIQTSGSSAQDRKHGDANGADKNLMLLRKVSIAFY